MKYIIVDKKKFDVKISDSPSPRSLSIASKLRDSGRSLSPIEYTLYMDIIYPAIYAEDKKKGINLRYYLFYPDPWLIALVALMWEGIVQGMTWDVMKILLNAALDKMRQAQIAPPDQKTLKKKEIESSTEMGFRYIEYSRDGRKLKECFLGLRRIYSRKTEDERLAISKSTISTPKKNKKIIAAKKNIPIKIKAKRKRSA